MKCPPDLGQPKQLSLVHHLEPNESPVREYQSLNTLAADPAKDLYSRIITQNGI